MGESGIKRSYPTGRRREATDEWKLRVLAKLEENARKDPPERPWDRASLAEALGHDKTGLGRLLLPNNQPKSIGSSKLVDPISQLLRIDPPSIAATDEDGEIMSLLSKLDERQKTAVLDLIRSFMGPGAKGRGSK